MPSTNTGDRLAGPNLAGYIDSAGTLQVQPILQPGGKWTLGDVDRFGRTVAAVAHAHWLGHQTGPTRRELLAVADICEFLPNAGLDHDRHQLSRPLRRAAGRGWVFSTREPRSLCAGHRFFTSTQRRRTDLSAESIGRSVGQAIGSFRYHHHRSPLVEELAAIVRNTNGSRLFRRGSDLTAQLPWLTQAGWVRFAGSDIRRGPTAKADKQQSAEARRRAGWSSDARLTWDLESRPM